MKTAHVALAALTIASATLLGGCPQSPESICQHMVDSIDAMYDRCGYRLHTVLTFDGVTASDCHHVTRISDGGNQIVHQCIPWTASVDCTTLVDDGSGKPIINPPCDFGMLQGRP